VAFDGPLWLRGQLYQSKAEHTNDILSYERFHCQIKSRCWGTLIAFSLFVFICNRRHVHIIKNISSTRLLRLVPSNITMDVPVLIVGTGPSGATAALHLGRLGIKSIVVSRHRGTSNTPRAHIFNQRAMEVLRDAGIEAQCYREASSMERRFCALAPMVSW
jgi:hypothetical protein